MNEIYFSSIDRVFFCAFECKSKRKTKKDYGTYFPYSSGFSILYATEMNQIYKETLFLTTKT